MSLPLSEQIKTGPVTLTVSLPAEPVSMTLQQAADAARGFGAALCAQFVERDREVASLLRAVVAQEHVLLLGPPGTAKSALTLAFAEGLGWSSFVRLMGKTTVPEELFGPYSLAALEQDRFERKIGGYLPTSQVAFLDEVFKANSAVLNGLLTALNERAFDQGTTRIGIPLEVCVGASNEMPQDDGLAALYDRFLIRHWVAYVRDDAAFERMLLGAGAPTSPARLDPEAVRVLRDAARRVDVSAILGSVVKIRAELAEKHAIVVSDRRWRKALGVVRASAALAGRLRATGRDLECLVDVLWDKVEQADPIRAVVMRNRNPNLVTAQRLHAVAAGVVAGVRKVDGDLSRLDMGGVARVTSAIGDVVKVLGEMKAIPDAESDVEVAEEVAKVRALGIELQSAVRAAQERFRL